MRKIDADRLNKYIKKPIAIEAIQWDGTTFNKIVEFVDKGILYVTEHGAPCKTNFDRYNLKLDTLEGIMNVSPYDYIIKGVKGEFYPCKEDIFLESYEVCHDERLQAKLEEYTELESEGNMEEYRSCDNCKHEYVEPSKYPCSICKYGDGTEDNWNTDKPKNYIAEFMKDNSIEVGEEFEIEGLGTYKITEYDCLVWVHNSLICQETFINLLTGKSKIRKPPKQEYVEVTNDVPRFTEIEVRDSADKKWEEATFIFKTEAKNDKYCYGVLDEGDRGLRYYKQARMLKPTEPEFKEGELIEVSDDGETWCERKYLGMFNGFYMTLAIAFNSPMGWKYARKIEGK